jgi:hypothetical protein
MYICAHFTKHVLNYQPRGRRDRGRPRKRWQRVDAGTGQTTLSMEEDDYGYDDMRPSATRPLAHLRSSPPLALMIFEVMEGFPLKQVAHHVTRAHIDLCTLSH